MLERKGKSEEAIEQLRAAIQDKPKFRMAHFQLGRLLLMKKRTGEALTQLSSSAHAGGCRHAPIHVWARSRLRRGGRLHERGALPPGGWPAGRVPGTEPASRADRNIP